MQYPHATSSGRCGFPASIALLLSLLVLALAGCTTAPAASTTPAAKSPETAKAAAVAESTPAKPAPWPCQLTDAAGQTIEIKAKPMRMRSPWP